MKSTIIGVVALVVVISGGYLLMSGSSVDANAQEVMDQSLTSALEMNSYTFEGEMNMNIKAEDGDGTMKFTYAGSSEKSALPDGAVTLEGQLNMVIDFDVNAEPKMKGNVVVDAVIDGEVFYLKFVLSDDLLKQIPVPMISSLNDSWIKISMEELKASGLLPPETLAQFDEQGGLYGNLEMQNQMIKLISESGIIKALSIKNGPTLDGKETYTLGVVIDSTKTGDFLIAYMKLVGGANYNDGAGDLMLSSEERKALEESIDKFFKDAEVEVIVEKESHFLRGLSVNAKINDPETKSSITLDGSFPYNDINEPAEVTVPAESTSIMEILAPFLGALMMAPAQ